MLLCSTSLPLASIRWVRSTFSSLCPLFWAVLSVNLASFKILSDKHFVNAGIRTHGVWTQGHCMLSTVRFCSAPLYSFISILVILVRAQGPHKTRDQPNLTVNSVGLLAAAWSRSSMKLWLNPPPKRLAITGSLLPLKTRKFLSSAPQWAMPY